MERDRRNHSLQDCGSMQVQVAITGKTEPSGETMEPRRRPDFEGTCSVDTFQGSVLSLNIN